MSGNLHVLFVEDLAVDAELCEHELRSSGLEFSSERVCTRAEFERVLCEITPDVILSDFSMPTDLDGFSALALARERAPGVPFIFVSGTIGEERAVEAVKAGATDYVLKDHLERLGPVVRRALKEAHDRQSIQRAEDALRASEATFRSFMQHLPGRAAIRDREGRYTYVNEAWQEVFGLKAEDVIGRRYDEVLDPQMVDELRHVHERIAQTNEPIKHVVRRGEGEAARWWLSHHFPIPGPNGNAALIGTVAIDVTEQKLQGEKLAYLASHDPLTGLLNRPQLHKRLTEALSSTRNGDSGTAVLVWDVKRFSTINDSFGRETGDELLRELAGRLKKLWPELTDMARLSGDHFGGIITETSDASRVALLLQDSAPALAQPYSLAGREITVDITVGIALCPHDGRDAETLLANAEAALKQAKTRGERYLFYETAMNARVAERLSLEWKLRRALDREQFFLHYEPKIDLRTGRTNGVEALLRWNDGHSIVSPCHFIPVLEDTGLILEVGRWALAKALQDRKARGGSSTPRVAVNVSAMQLRRTDFVDMVAKVIDGFGGGEHGLDLEITETVLMEDIEANAAKLHALKEMGVNIAIDDFGTGYSSLSYLAALPVDALKIDRAFIGSMVEKKHSMTIVSTVISLAHTLRMVVVAEGVETSGQANLLRDLHCDQAQGFFFSRAQSRTGSGSEPQSVRFA